MNYCNFLKSYSKTFFAQYKSLTFVAAIVVLFTVCGAAAKSKSFTDPRDGQTYRIVTIGNQTWFAENLNYATASSYCYNNSETYCDEYGRLYTWDAANNACPSGWHLPSRSEWAVMLVYISKNPKNDTASVVYNIADKLKSKVGWKSVCEDAYPGKFCVKSRNGNGKDKYGFSVLPAGYRNSDGNFSDVVSNAIFWSASESGDDAYDLNFYYVYEDADWYYDGKVDSYSVRCLRDCN